MKLAEFGKAKKRQICSSQMKSQNLTVLWGSPKFLSNIKYWVFKFHSTYFPSELKKNESVLEKENGMEIKKGHNNIFQKAKRINNYDWHKPVWFKVRRKQLYFNNCIYFHFAFTLHCSLKKGWPHGMITVMVSWFAKLSWILFILAAIKKLH